MACTVDPVLAAASADRIRAVEDVVRSSSLLSTCAREAAMVDQKLAFVCSGGRASIGARNVPEVTST